MDFMFIPLVFGLGFGEIAIIVFVIVLLFGAKRIPELMRGLGKGVSNFKEGLKSPDGKDVQENSKDNPEGK